MLVAGLACAQDDDPAQLIRRADDLKTADNAQFQALVRGLERDRERLPPLERAWLDYLQAWQAGYAGDIDAALPALEAVIARSDDATLRFRAGVTQVNDLALVGRYDEAYSRLEKLLEAQAQVPDKPARMLGHAVAALLYNQAGQFELGSERADRWLAENPDESERCKAWYLKLDAQFRSGKLVADDPAAAAAIAGCERAGERLYSNLIRTFLANLQIANGHAGEAIRLLHDNDAAVQATNSARVRSEFHSLLARAYLATGDLVRARQYAASAVERAISDEPSRPLVDAYGVLADVARRQGDYRAALEYHEKFTAADKRYLGDTSAQALAYQMVRQQVDEKKHQLEALHEKNQLLQLQREMTLKSAETERLYILLLLLVIAFVLLWTFRLRRSQMRYQKLARRDGLTGIVNRQHFMDEAKNVLQACARGEREVCLILVDLDNFKVVNDTHGHVAGDGVLRQTVEMCQLHMRPVDLFGRLGGEEFGILLQDCAIDTARERAEELRAAIESFAQAGVEITVSASFGVASTDGSGHDLRQLLIRADSALYRAKRNGRNRVEVEAGPVPEPVLAVRPPAMRLPLPQSDN
jgi:diguanylate cyclase (GGDEF)-like protein